MELLGYVEQVVKVSTVTPWVAQVVAMRAQADFNGAGEVNCGTVENA